MQSCCQLLQSVAKSRAEFYFVQRFAQQKNLRDNPCYTVQFSSNLSRRLSQSPSHICYIRSSTSRLDRTLRALSQALRARFLFLPEQYLWQVYLSRNGIARQVVEKTAQCNRALIYTPSKKLALNASRSLAASFPNFSGLIYALF